MPKRLSVREQRILLGALPKHRINAAHKHCIACAQRGDGLKDIMKSVGKVLGGVAKDLGPTVLKKFVLPFVKKHVLGGSGHGGSGLKLAGEGLKLAGEGHCGSGLKLAGSGRRPKKKSRKK